MFVTTPLPSVHCELCSLDTNEDVLCPSCREMIHRLLRITSYDSQTKMTRTAATMSATMRAAMGRDVPFVFR